VISLRAEVLDDLVATYKQEQIATLAEDVRRAHIIGDLLGQRHLRNAGVHTHGITNALPEKWTYAPKRSTEYGYTPDLHYRDKWGKLGKLSFEHVAKEAETYLVEYKRQLEDLGGTIIDGKPVAWLEDHCQSVRADVAATIEDGIREGWSTKAVAAHLSEVMEGSRSKLMTIARTEMMRVQHRGAITRYQAAGVETVIRINGPNPCDECAAESGEEYPIDAVPEDHPNGSCDFIPNIRIPPPEEALIDENEIAKLLEEAGA